MTSDRVAADSFTRIDDRMVFIVDDDRAIRRALRRVLRALGCEIHLFATAEDLLAAMTELQPDLVVSDYNMPGMDGLVLLEILRTDHAHVRTIMLTGAAVREEIWDAVGAGRFDRLLHKPWSDEGLRSVVRELLSAGATMGEGGH